MKNANIAFKAERKAGSIELMFISADSTLQEAATMMRDRQCSVLRVSDKGKMENVISAYDIIINAVAHNKTAAETKVRHIMGRSYLPTNSSAVAFTPVKTAQSKAAHSRKPGRLAFNAGIKS